MEREELIGRANALLAKEGVDIELLDLFIEFWNDETRDGGLSNKEIAQRMGISRSQAKKRRQKLGDQLGAGRGI